jgi:hypothetical protein
MIRRAPVVLHDKGVEEREPVLVLYRPGLEKLGDEGIAV